MNNGAMIRGPEGDTEGITEQRINTWFTNRRKGLTTPVTPSPTKGTHTRDEETRPPSRGAHKLSKGQFVGFCHQ